jgi:hypothetical protein
MDVHDAHKETIAVATAEKHGTPRYYGEIANTAEAITTLVKKGSTIEKPGCFLL